MLLLVAFSAGTLLGAAFFDIIPEAVELIGDLAFTYVLIGILLFFIMERFIFWHHCHTHNHKIQPFTYLNLVGDGLHNFIDGAIIAAAYLTNFGVGVVATVAIALHEIPQEIGDFAILIHGGMEKKKAIMFNFLSAFMAVIGALLMFYAAPILDNLIPILLGIAGGGFIHVAAGDLFPELKHEEDFKKLTLQTFVIILGIVLIYWVNIMV